MQYTKEVAIHFGYWIAFKNLNMVVPKDTYL